MSDPCPPPPLTPPLLSSPTGWVETTYLNTGIRIARGNKGSIFVLTRQPVSYPGSQQQQPPLVA